MAHPPMVFNQSELARLWNTYLVYKKLGKRDKAVKFLRAYRKQKG